MHALCSAPAHYLTQAASTSGFNYPWARSSVYVCAAASNGDAMPATACDQSARELGQPSLTCARVCMCVCACHQQHPAPSRASRPLPSRLRSDRSSGSSPASSSSNGAAERSSSTSAAVPSACCCRTHPSAPAVVHGSSSGPRRSASGLRSADSWESAAPMSAAGRQGVPGLQCCWPGSGTACCCCRCSAATPAAWSLAHNPPAGTDSLTIAATPRATAAAAEPASVLGLTWLPG